MQLISTHTHIHTYLSIISISSTHTTTVHITEHCTSCELHQWSKHLNTHNIDDKYNYHNHGTCMCEVTFGFLADILSEQRINRMDILHIIQA